MRESAEQAVRADYSGLNACVVPRVAYRQLTIPVIRLGEPSWSPAPFLNLGFATVKFFGRFSLASLATLVMVAFGHAGDCVPCGGCSDPCGSESVSAVYAGGCGAVGGSVV